MQSIAAYLPCHAGRQREYVNYVVLSFDPPILYRYCQMKKVKYHKLVKTQKKEIKVKVKEQLTKSLKCIEKKEYKRNKRTNMVIKKIDMFIRKTHRFRRHFYVLLAKCNCSMVSDLTLLYIHRSQGRHSIRKAAQHKERSEHYGLETQFQILHSRTTTLLRSLLQLGIFQDEFNGSSF